MCYGHGCYGHYHGGIGVGSIFLIIFIVCLLLLSSGGGGYYYNVRRFVNFCNYFAFLFFQRNSSCWSWCRRPNYWHKNLCHIQLISTFVSHSEQTPEIQLRSDLIHLLLYLFFCINYFIEICLVSFFHWFWGWLFCDLKTFVFNFQAFLNDKLSFGISKITNN